MIYKFYVKFLMIFFYYYLELIPGSSLSATWRPLAPEVRHLLQFGTSSTRAGGPDDVSYSKLPQMTCKSCFITVILRM